MKTITMGNKGFSLVELMVAVGIIGSMSAVAVPNYAKFKAKSLQATAQQNLSNIYTLQNLYFTEHDEYGDDTNIEFKVDSSSKYHYYIQTTATPNAVLTHATIDTNIISSGDDEGTGDQIGFKATAMSDGHLAACAANADHWCLNQDKILANVVPSPANDALPCDTTANKDFYDGGC